MNNPDSVAIINRFYKALGMLKNKGLFEGKKDFAIKHGIEYTSFSRCELKPESDRFQIAWISLLTTKYDASLEWIMTGKGNVFTEQKK